MRDDRGRVNNPPQVINHYQPAPHCWHKNQRIDTLGSVDVPASIQRIEQFPASGLALLNKIPARSGESIDIGDLLEQEPFLLNALGQIAGDSDDPAAG